MFFSKKSPFMGLKLTFSLVLLISLLGAQQASALDYYTRLSGPWATPGTWSNVGYGGIAAPLAPGVADIVHIGNNNVVTVGAAASCLTLIIDNTGSLLLDGFTFQVLGTTTIGGGVSGSIGTLNSGAGTKTFLGGVTVNTNGTWNLAVQNPATSFAGGITVNAGGTFNNGSGAAAFTVSQNLAGAGNMIFGGTITPSALTTLTNNNTGTVTVSSTGSIVLTGGFTQGPGSTLSVQAAAPFSGVGTFNANASANVVNYSGAAQTIKNVTYRTLTLSASGVKTFAGSTAITTDFNMSGTASTTTNIPTIGGNVTLTGAAQMTMGTACAVTGSVDIGTGTKLTMGNFAFSVGTTTSVTGQMVTSGGNTGTRTFTGAVTVNAGGVWNLSGQNPVTSFGGGIAMNGTTFNNGNGAAGFSATQALSGAAAMTFGGTVTPAGGTTLTNNNTSSVSVSNSVVLTGNFTQGTNSTLLLTGGTPFSGAGTLDAGTNVNTINYTGAVQTVKAVTYSSLTLSTNGTKTVTGVSTINGNLTLSGTVSVTPNLNLSIGGNFTLGAGTTFVGGTHTHDVGGNWINNGGTFTNTNTTIELDGTTQSIGGTNTTTFNNLTIAGTGTKTLSIATTVSSLLDIEEGALVDNGGLTTHTANRLRFSGNGQTNGTWGGTGSGATNISSNYFTAASGRITIATTTSQTLPYIEDFNADANGTTQNLVPSWNVTQFPSGGTFSKQTPIILLGEEGFEISGTGAQEGVWQTADLDIGANVAEVGISLEVSTLGTSSPNDYVNVYYVWDGGFSSSEVLISSVTTTVTAPFITLSATGHTKIRLVVRAKETTTIFGFPLQMAFDNVNIVPIRTLYSRQTSTWATSGTWSTVGINGADCACTPTAAGYDKVFIGGGNTVTLGAAGAASALSVFGTADVGGAGTLNLNTSGLTIDFGGNVTVNAGGIITGTATSSLTISDNQSHTITDNGSVTVGALTFDNAGQYSSSTYTINGAGTFTATGNFSETTNFLGGLTGQTNMPITLGGITNIGTAFVTPLQFINNSTVNMTSTAANTLAGSGQWTQGANSTLNFSGANISIATIDASASGNTVDYIGAGAQTIQAIQYWNLNLSTSGAKTLGGDVSLRGNWTRSGTATFAHANNQVTFNGTTASQTTTAETFYDLVTQNSFATAPQIIMNGNVTVANTLVMTSGVINMNSFTLSLTSTAAAALSHAGTSNLGWAYNGTFSRQFPVTAITIGTAAGLIPIGTSTDFRPFYFGKSNTGGSAGTIALTHTDPNTTTVVSIADTNPVATIIIRRNSPWGSTLTGGTGATFGIRYGGTGMGTVANVSHLRSMLLNSVIATNVAGSGTTSDFRVERSGLTAAQMTNNFYVGSTNAASTLPVELVSFDGIARPYGVELRWKTESEVNSDYFTVLHQTPEGEFKAIGKVAGNGTTNAAHEYSLVDYKPVIGKNYYKLSQTDFDGHTYNHGLVMVEIISLNGLQIAIYPNPAPSNRQIDLEMKGFQPQGSMEFQIIDMRGLTLKRGIGIADETGSVKASIDLTNASPGIYILKVSGGQFKFVVE
jgi:hypothetical protein